MASPPYILGQVRRCRPPVRAGPGNPGYNRGRKTPQLCFDAQQPGDVVEGAGESRGKIVGFVFVDLNGYCRPLNDRGRNCLTFVLPHFDILSSSTRPSRLSPSHSRASARRRDCCALSIQQKLLRFHGFTKTGKSLKRPACGLICPHGHHHICHLCSCHQPPHRCSAV